MSVTTDGFRMMTRAMQAIADSACNGKLVLAQEGGYGEVYAPYCTLAVFEELLGQRTDIEEPLDPERTMKWPSSVEVSGDQRASLDAIGRHQSQYWSMD
jgi:acetoin utilization deacetylase AcuC-like enzyme